MLRRRDRRAYAQTVAYLSQFPVELDEFAEEGEPRGIRRLLRRLRART